MVLARETVPADYLRYLPDDLAELVEEYNAQQANSYMTVVVYALEDRAKRLVVEIAALTALFAAGAQVSWFAVGGRRKGARIA